MPGIHRRDHVTEIGPGQTLLLYTDGLVEVRTESIDYGYNRLLETLASLTGQGLDNMLDSLLTQVVGDSPDDDVALVAVRFHPEDQPRPVEAGPTTD